MKLFSLFIVCIYANAALAGILCDQRLQSDLVARCHQIKKQRADGVNSDQFDSGKVQLFVVQKDFRFSEQRVESKQNKKYKMPLKEKTLCIDLDLKNMTSSKKNIRLNNLELFSGEIENGKMRTLKYLDSNYITTEIETSSTYVPAVLTEPKKYSEIQFDRHSKKLRLSMPIQNRFVQMEFECESYEFN
jgi:hypothetical protein